MRLVLFGATAFSYWLTAETRPPQSCAVGGACLVRCMPRQQSIEHLEACFPHLRAPYHCLVPATHRRAMPRTMCHISRFPYEKGCFYRIADGVYVSSPELCFLQMAQSTSLPELVKLGSALCGRFFLRPSASSGLGTRRSLTTPRRMAAFVQRHAGHKGVKAARRALPLLVGNAASPPEIFLRMVLGLPRMYGGYGLLGSCANRRLRVSKRAQAISERGTLVPDLYWPEHRLVIEYDSNAEHLTGVQVSRDAKKRLALGHDDFRVITVTTRQLSRPESMRHVAGEVARTIGRPLRIRGKEFPAKQGALYRTGWSFDGYVREGWAQGAVPLAPPAVAADF